VRSNQTVVIGGLMQEVETESESKVPILGDIPLIGALFRNKRKTKRKTNLLIFLTPHVIDSPEDLQEIYKVKMMQREEFMRRFYGKSRKEQLAELDKLVRFSMNLPDRPSVYSSPSPEPEEARYSEPGVLNDTELREALDGLEDTGGATLITPDGEVEFGSAGSEEEGEADEAEASPPVPEDGSEQQGE